MSPENPVVINQVSPIGGSLAGGYTVTITGAEFQEGAIVYFGEQLSEKSIVKNNTIMEATVPGTNESGTVAVTVVNPDESQFTLDDAFTYVTTEDSGHAEVAGISPLTVIEDVETEVILRGRNLIQAYENGLVALRGPSRVEVKISDVSQSSDEESGIDSLTFNVSISATPALEPKERIAIQILASTRPEAQDDLIVESSKQMFTVLPKDIPVPIAYTPSLNSDKSTMVVVLGRNLDDCMLEFGEGIQNHLQKSDEDSLVGLVSISKETSEISSQFSILDKNGNPIEQYNLALVEENENSSNENGESSSAVFMLDMIQVEGQLFLGPTAEDSRLFYLSGKVQIHPGYDFSNYGIEVFSYSIRIPIIRIVSLFPMFDGGGPNRGSLISAQVGDLFPLRGMGILFATRIEVTIVITVVVIITIDFPWLSSGFNEFPEVAPNAMLSIITGIIIDIEIILIIGFLNALVLPDGSLQVLIAFNLTVNIDFRIILDGHGLSFIPNFTHRVRYYSILPFAESLPCGGRFQLAEDNGQTIFPDGYGGRQAYYFVRSAGECCVSWNFNLELVRFRSGGDEQVIRSPFSTNMCITAQPNLNLMSVIIISDPPPQGIPPTLIMNIADSAILRAFGQPVDQTGNPTGPLQDLRDLGYNVEFFLGLPPELLDPTTLPEGNAFAIQAGQNIIHAAISFRTSGGQLPFAFWYGTILGFHIIRYLAEGEAPRAVAGNLPLQVNPQVTDIKVNLSMAYKDSAGRVIPVSDLYRDEPDATTPREYFLAAKFEFPPNTPTPIKVKLKVESAKMLVDNSPTTPPFPADTFGSEFDRSSGTTIGQFFKGSLLGANFEPELTLNTLPMANEFVVFDNAKLSPNREETVNATGDIVDYVPPGTRVTAHLVSSCDKTDRNNSTCRRNVAVELKLKDLKITNPNGSTTYPSTLRTPQIVPKVINDETFEEYFRVFHEVRTLMTQRSERSTANSLGSFTKELIGALPQSGSISDAFLRERGEKLWKLGYEFVQGGKEDDRILYFSRLEAMAVLRDVQNRNLTRLTENQLNIFEYTSRGLTTTNGSDARIAFAGEPHKVVVTGFDPFLLPDYGLISNSSGIIALSLNGKEFMEGNPQKNFKIRTTVLPVRFRDFGTSGTNSDGLIEKIMKDAVNICDLIMTCSWTPDDKFNIDRFAARYRTNTTPDNERILSHINHPLGMDINQVPYYLESTLPYTPVGVVKVPDVNPGTFKNRKVTGPSPGTQPTTYLIINQSFSLALQNPPNCTDRGVGSINTPEAYEKTGRNPAICGELTSGSGGNYLSNEIFYRTARIRLQSNPSFPTGHLHVPTVELDPLVQDKGKNVAKGGEEILRSLLPYATSLSGTIQIIFPDTIINSAGVIRTITIDVPANYPNDVVISAVEFSQTPSAFQAVSFSPLTIPRGSSGTIQVKFVPTEIRDYTDVIKLKNSDQMVLYSVELKGKGIGMQPVISGFAPISGYEGDTITITGQNFTGATEVKIGSTSVNFSVANDSRISAEVSSAVPLGMHFITVTTPSGTATSSTKFTRRITRPTP